MAKIGINKVRINGVSVPTITTPLDLDMMWNSFNIPHYGCDFIWEREKKKQKMPKKYIINKGATILFWDEDEEEKTIVKRSKDDKFNKRLGFLTAYFQYHSGLSKTQANKYLDSLEVEKEK